MKKFLCLYGLYIKTFFKARAEYRLNFWMGIIANFYTYFITFLNFWIITSRFETIGGWDFKDMSVLYGLNLFTYAVAGTFVWYNVYHLEKEIVSGGLDRYLVRPMGIVQQLICSRFGETFIGQIVVTIVFLIGAIAGKMSVLSIGSVLYFCVVLVSGTLLQMGAMILVGSISFWTTRSIEIGSVFYYQLRNLTHYPLSIYPAWIRYLLTYLLPWAFINYYPAQILLGKEVTVWEWWLGVLSPVVGVLVFLASLLVFRCGLRHYSSAGN